MYSDSCWSNKELIYHTERWQCAIAMGNKITSQGGHTYTLLTGAQVHYSLNFCCHTLVMHCTSTQHNTACSAVCQSHHQESFFQSGLQTFTLLQVMETNFYWSFCVTYFFLWFIMWYTEAVGDLNSTLLHANSACKQEKAQWKLIL